MQVKSGYNIQWPRGPVKLYTHTLRFIRPFARVETLISENSVHMMFPHEYTAPMFQGFVFRDATFTRLDHCQPQKVVAVCYTSPPGGGVGGPENESQVENERILILRPDGMGKVDPEIRQHLFEFF